VPLWAKGQSANPGGRPKGHGDLRELARQHAPDALAVLVRVMNDPAASPGARVTAACALLDRGYGRPETKARLEIASVDLGERLQRAQARVLAGTAVAVPDAPVARLVASEEASSTYRPDLPVCMTISRDGKRAFSGQDRRCREGQYHR